MMRGIKTEGGAVRRMRGFKQDARGAALSALFECAQAVKHAGVAGQQFADGA